jgi:hypothetical protein
MDIEGRVLKSDHVGRVFFTASPDDIDKIYQDRLTFWRDRHGAMAHAEIREQAIAGQGKNYNHGMKKPLGAALEAMCRNASPDRIPSILELGGADGITLRHLRDKIPDFRARYVGIEPCSVFVDHFKAQFPDAHVIVGDAAKLIKMPIKRFSNAPYQAFVASLSLCMIKPEVVRKVLSRAARLRARSHKRTHELGPDSCEKVIGRPDAARIDGRPAPRKGEPGFREPVMPK